MLVDRRSDREGHLTGRRAGAEEASDHLRVGAEAGSLEGSCRGAAAEGEE